MTRLKLTSPGTLLILATGMAGAILLLDVFFLRPHVAAQKDAALHEQAIRSVQGVRQALQSEQSFLANLCRVHAQMSEVAACLGAPDASQGFCESAARALAGSSTSLGWLCDPSGRVVAFWHSEDVGWSDPTSSRDLAEMVKSVHSVDDGEDVGLMRICGRGAVLARAPVRSSDGGKPLGRLWLARFLDPQVMKKIGLVVGGDVVLVADSSLPPGAVQDASTSQAYWPAGEDRLAVAWLARDYLGQVLGYFRADIPVGHIHGQAAAARRIILIVLSLSVGLVSLIIMGTHMLIAGPVVRLLRRLQQIDAGAGTLGTLTRDLHGEPLVLARRLESAFERLAHMSKTDQLTGLANRRHFQEVLGAFYHQSRRYNRPLSVMVMDVDFFKAVNDTAGHQAGDDVLKLVAGAIERACRKADLPARLGGDEFAVLLPETYSGDAIRVADRILQNVSSEPVVVKNLRLNLTVSVGVADLNAGEIDSPETMISLADKALYTAKEAGRNRVVMAHDLEGVALSGGPQDNRKVDVLYKRLAGLDSRFKDLFLHAVEEVVEVMQERDPNMADHARKVQHYAILIAREMGLPERVVKRIEVAAMLHDIGMLALPDSILLHPGPLEDEQMRKVRQHPLLSCRIMERMEFLEQEIPAVRYHHERYDGKGYPEGIAGPAIPLTARILAVADAFDAMTSPRAFRQAMSWEGVLGEIQRAAGTQFDPAVVEAIVSVASRVGEKVVEPPRTQREPRWREGQPAEQAQQVEAASAPQETAAEASV
ncbi:MAG TPA: diguanylate cyclase [Phycisphaerae bacterium]|nr:diguanylate cyclase [Phycisphaerae bacterium]